MVDMACALPSSDSDNNATTRLVNCLKKMIPKYCKRAMQREFIHRFQLIANVTPTVLTEMYRFLTGDSSALSSEISKQVNRRLRLALDAQDPELVFDLRHFYSGPKTQFDDFWEAAQQFIQEEAMQAVHSQHHGQVCFKALALSTRDFIDQVKKKLPEDALMPSE